MELGLRGSDVVKRGVGYCENSECEDFLKGVFLLNHGNTFYCPRCRTLGFVEPEIKRDLGPADPNVMAVYKSVRVHFNFVPSAKEYREIAIVDIPEIPLGEAFELYSPLIKTEQRALKVAHGILCAVNSGMRDGVMTEFVLDMDKPNYRDRLADLSAMLDEREKRVVNAIAP